VVALLHECSAWLVTDGLPWKRYHFDFICKFVFFRKGAFQLINEAFRGLYDNE